VQSRPFSLLANLDDDKPGAAPILMSQPVTTWWELREPKSPPSPEPRPDDQPQLSPEEEAFHGPEYGW